MKKKRAKREDTRFANVVSISSLAISLASIVIALYAIWSNERIAERSGAFDKAAPIAHIGEHRLSADTTLIFYGLAAHDSILVQSSIPLVVTNHGQLDIRDLSVTFRYPTVSQLALASGFLGSTSVGRFEASETTRRHSRDRDIEYVAYRVPYLSPGETFILSEPIILMETSLTDTVHMPDVSERLIAGVSYSIRATISVSGRDVSVTDYPVEISILSVDNLADFKEKVDAALRGQPPITPSGTSTWIPHERFPSDWSAIAVYAEPDTLLIENGIVGVDADAFDNLYYLSPRRFN